MNYDEIIVSCFCIMILLSLINSLYQFTQLEIEFAILWLFISILLTLLINLYIDERFLLTLEELCNNIIKK